MLVPLKFTLGTSAAVVKAVPLLLVDLLNEDGVTGRAYMFCYRPSGAVAISSHLFEAVDILKLVRARRRRGNRESEKQNREPRVRPSDEIHCAILFSSRGAHLILSRSS